MDRDASLVSPVDGVLSEFGRVEEGRISQVKGRNYTVAELLGSASRARVYEGGTYLTIYLSPSHYHRIHAPVSGSLGEARYHPGTLFPVNAPAVAGIDRLFPRNERVDCEIDTAGGKVVLVAVGALCVGRISTAFDGEWNGPSGRGVSNRRPRAAGERRYAPPVEVGAGDELMTFHLGSTVVLLLEGETIRLDDRLRIGASLRLGQALATR